LAFGGFDRDISNKHRFGVSAKRVVFWRGLIFQRRTRLAREISQRTFTYL